MNDFLDAIVSNGTVLLAGGTLLLTVGCLAVAAHHSPVHRQRLAESAIVATLIWAILAVTPLPRPLARGYLADLTRATAPKAPPSVAVQQNDAVPLSAVASAAGVSPAVATANAVPAQLALARTVTLVSPVTMDEVALDAKSFGDPLPPHWQTLEMEPEAFSFVPGNDSSDLAALDDSPRAVVDDSGTTRPVPAVCASEAQPGDQVAAAPAIQAASPIGPAPSVEAAPHASSTAATSTDTIEPMGLGARLAGTALAHWKLLLFGGYALGVAVCASWILLGRGLLAVIVATSQRPEEWLEELFADLCDERGARKGRLLVSRRYPRAMSFGIFRPTIVLPAAQCVPQNAEILRHVLRHELVHVDRRDAWGTLLFNVAFLLLFFHPAFWWLRSRARMSAECLADEWAASRSSRDEYARELIAFVRATRRTTFLPAGATGVLGSTTPFSRRIEMLIRRERPLVLSSSPVWRITTCGALGGLIIVMAASLGRTAQDEPPAPDKAVGVTVHVDATNVTGDDNDPIKIVATRDDDDNLKVIATDDDDDTADANQHGHKELERMKKEYTKLARKSAELQMQMAKLQLALERAKAGGEPKSSASSREPGAKEKVLSFDIDGQHFMLSGPEDEVLKEAAKTKAATRLRKLEKEGKGEKDHAKSRGPHKRIIINGKLLDSDGKASEVRSNGTINLDGERFVISITPDGKTVIRSADGKGEDERGAKKSKSVSVKTKKKGEKPGEEKATIELKTDEGEMELEIGPDQQVKVKKFVGFGKTPAESEAIKKLMENLSSLQHLPGLPDAEQFKKLGELKALEALKGLDFKELDQLKELGQLKDLEQLKKLGDLKDLEQLKQLGQLKILIQPDGPFGVDAGEGHGVKKHGKKDRHGDKEEGEQSHARDFDFYVTPDAFPAQEQARRAQKQAHKAHMDALRAQIEAQQKVLERLKKQAEKMRHETEDSKDDQPSTSAPRHERQTTRRMVVRAEHPAASQARAESKGMTQAAPRAGITVAAADPGVQTVPYPITTVRTVPHPITTVRTVPHPITTLRTVTHPIATIVDPTDKLTASRVAATVEKRQGAVAEVKPAIQSTSVGGSSTDPVRLAELVSNAIGEFDAAKAALNAPIPGDNPQTRVAAETRLHSAERKLRLLGRIVQSLHDQAAAQAKRTNNQHDQDEFDARLRILELILSDLNSAVGKSATSATPAASVAESAPAAKATTVATAAVAPRAATSAAAPAATAIATPARPAAPAPATSLPAKAAVNK